MANVRCPNCGKPNPKEQETCRFCGTRLKPIDSDSIQAGDQPVIKDTSEFEKVQPADQGTIRPGDAPTKKNTADLEKALPSWLRSLREGKGPSAEEPQEQSLPTTPAAPAGAEPSGDLPDWLAGLGKAGDRDEEEVPEWLAGLRSDSGTHGASASEPEAEDSPSNETEWMASLGRELKGETSTPQPAAQPPASEEPLPDWLQSLQSEPEEQTPPAAPASGQGQGMTNWLQSFQSEPEAKTPKAGAQPVETPDWLASFQSAAGGNKPLSTPPADNQESVPDWLSNLPGIPTPAEQSTGENAGMAPAEDMPDWLKQLKEKSNSAEPGPAGKSDESVPDWLSGFGSAAPGTPAASSGESVPEWLSNLEAKSGNEPETPATVFTEKPPASSTAPEEIPDWLSSFKSDVNAASEAEEHKNDYEVVSELPDQNKQTGPLPDWLAGIQASSTPAGGTPALIDDGQEQTPDQEAASAFSMETPDWLSNLKPEEKEEKAPEGRNDELANENLEVSDLPNWVQAMRPVESVVADAKPAAPEDALVTENSGPLAGLRGVLPAVPGLGTLRKPPAYSVKLQVTDGQQRYAAYLERLVSSEAQPQKPAPTGLASSQLWRWAITILLIVAVILPLFTGFPAVPEMSVLSPSMQLAPSDKGMASALVDGLPENTPVLIAFEYDPALSGELEAAAAPLIDKLLSKQARLTLISTSPTGPALAEQFIQQTTLINIHQYQSGEQYVNLGYLAGGQAGVLYFALDPQEAASDTTNGQPAWETKPLQGVQSIRDFKALIILTDNADTGRNWIEQAGPYLGSTPMIMVISAQAEPMLRPYFDSGQIKGLVTGLVDAKLQEQANSTPGLAYHYWGSFSLAVLVAEILIVIGAVWGVIAGWRARAKNSGGEA
jgi:endogenous inhibitor of DNA gyrase (YacG/DUF329 family)